MIYMGAAPTYSAPHLLAPQKPYPKEERMRWSRILLGLAPPCHCPLLGFGPFLVLID